MLHRIRTVLINTTHSGNIGACARAMMNMGLSKLYLVSPKAPVITDESQAMAAGAKDLIQKAIVVDTLNEALADTIFVLGASARKRTLSGPVFEPETSAKKIFEVLEKEKTADIALVFGSESHGLSNEALQQCHGQILIPANPLYSSLNLAQALLLIGYEIFKQSLEPTRKNNNDELSEPSRLATFEEMEGFYSVLEKTMMDVHFLKKENPRNLMSHLRRLFSKSMPNQTELNILRGLLTAIQKQV